MSDALLHCDGLHTLVGGPYALELACAEIGVIQGPSGCGKSLLLRALADLDAHRGQVSSGGIHQDRVSAPQWRSRVAYVPAESGWWADTVGPHLPEHALRGAWLQQLGLSNACLDWEIGRCSSGERQRLALIAALCREPALLLLDEPTAACDAQTTAAMESLLRAWVQAGPRAILMISHDQAQAQRLGQRQWQMDAQAGLHIGEQKLMGSAHE